MSPAIGPAVLIGTISRSNCWSVLVVGISLEECGAKELEWQQLVVWKVVRARWMVAGMWTGAQHVSCLGLGGLYLKRNGDFNRLFSLTILEFSCRALSSVRDSSCKT